MLSEEQLYTELGALRKGMGLQHPRLRDRLGPELRRLCGVDDTVTHSAARARLREVLLQASGALPNRLGLAVLVMLAVEPAYDGATLTLRQRQLAAAWNVDHMTVRRRCDQALHLTSAHLAEHGATLTVPEAQDGDSFGADGWYTLTSRITLRLDTPTPEATDVRTLVSLRDGLDRIALGMAVPRTRSDTRARMGLDLEVQFGGLLDSVRQPSAEYFVHYIRFPRPLARGEEHTFAKVARVPPGQIMVPRFVSRPLHRVDRFELRLKFDPKRLPRVVWRVSGIPYHPSEADGPGRDRLELDSVGETATVFERLKPSFGYGVCWLF